MRALYGTALALAMTLSAVAADDARPLNVKTGLWNVTLTTKTSGAPPVPAEQVEKLPPEQRARLEQMWKDRQAKGAQTKSSSHCITDEQLKDRDAFIEDEGSCSRTVITSTGKELNVRVQCISEEGTRTSTYHIQALSAENIKGEVHIEASGGGKTMEISHDFTAKWSGPVCETAK